MATAGDISWQSPQGIFNLRVAAILTSGGEILLCTIEGLDYWFLPGGRIRLGEHPGLDERRTADRHGLPAVAPGAR